MIELDYKYKSPNSQEENKYFALSIEEHSMYTINRFLQAPKKIRISLTKGKDYPARLKFTISNTDHQGCLTPGSLEILLNFMGTEILFAVPVTYQINNSYKFEGNHLLTQHISFKSLLEGFKDLFFKSKQGLYPLIVLTYIDDNLHINSTYDSIEGETKLLDYEYDITILLMQYRKGVEEYSGISKTCSFLISQSQAKTNYDYISRLVDKECVKLFRMENCMNICIWYSCNEKREYFSKELSDDVRGSKDEINWSLPSNRLKMVLYIKMKMNVVLDIDRKWLKCVYDANPKVGFDYGHIAFGAYNESE